MEIFILKVVGFVSAMNTSGEIIAEVGSMVIGFEDNSAGFRQYTLMLNNGDYFMSWTEAESNLEVIKKVSLDELKNFSSQPEKPNHMTLPELLGQELSQITFK